MESIYKLDDIVSRNEDNSTLMKITHVGFTDFPYPDDVIYYLTYIDGKLNGETLQTGYFDREINIK